MNAFPIPAFVQHCLSTLEAAGYRACPVGGCVRDLLLGTAPHDWDVATAAPPEAVVALFSRTVPTGLRHGTVTVLIEGEHIEVTAFRREGGYSDGRRPDRVFFDADLHDDLARRDFTINAMALTRDGAVIDPFGGRADLAARLVRCVGDPRRRFSEDGLRLFRMVRFAAVLGFSVEADTAAAFADCAPMGERVAGERICTELEKILCSDRPELAALLVESGLLARFGARRQTVDLTPLRAREPTPAARWGGLCALTGLDITRLPVTRALRRAVLHPELAELEALALTGGDLYRLGLRGAQIKEARLLLLAQVRARPQDNRREVLLRAVQALPPAASPEKIDSNRA